MDRRSVRLRELVHLAAGLAVLLPALGPAVATPSSPPTGVATHVGQLTLDQLVDLLGSPDYAQRQRATQILKSKDKTAAEALKRMWAGIPDHETRLRLREVAEFLFYRDALEQLGGFLGISLQAVDHRDVSGLQEGEAAIHVVQVLPGTAAARAGVQEGDLIVAVDGERVRVTRGDASRFISLIGARPPGTQVALTFLRQSELVTEDVVLGFKPLSHISEMLLPDEQERLLEAARRQFERWCDDVDGGS